LDAAAQGRLLVVFPTASQKYAVCEEHLPALSALLAVVSAGLPTRCTLDGRDIMGLRRDIINGKLYFIPYGGPPTFFAPPEESCDFQGLSSLAVYVAPAAGAVAPAAAASAKKKRTLQRAEHIDTSGRIRWKTLYKHGCPIDLSMKWLAQGCAHAGMRNYPWPFTLANKMVVLDPAYYPAQIMLLGLEKFLTDLYAQLQLIFKTQLDIELTYSTPTQKADSKADSKQDGKHPIVTQMINDIIGNMRCIGLVIMATGAKWTDVSEGLQAQQNLLYKLCTRIKLGVQHPGTATSVTPPWYYRELKGPNSLGKGELPDGLEIVEEVDDEVIE